MRVTLNSFKMSSIRDLLDVQNDVIKLEEKIASTKEVNMPSDDPLRFVTAAQYKSELRSRNQYLRDITDAEEYLENNQAVISRIKALLQSTRTLLVQASNDTMATADMQANAEQLRETLEDIVSAANSQGPDGKAFGGTATGSNPFEVVRDADGDITDVIYRGNSQSITRQISDSNSIPINRIGSQFFQVEPVTVTSSRVITAPDQPLDTVGMALAEETGSFNIQGHSIHFDIGTDSLNDIATRINQVAPEVEASVISEDGTTYQLQIAPRDADQLFAYDEGSARFLVELGITDGTANTPANLVPTQTEDRSLFNIFIDAIASLDHGDGAAIRDESLAEWDNALAGMSKQATEVAGLQQTLASTASAHDDLILQDKSVISSNEDIDIASALTELQRLQLKMQAAIGATTSITFDSLANYI